MRKVYHSDKRGYSFLLFLLTVAVLIVISLLRYLLEKLEIMFPALFVKEKALPEYIIYGLIIAFAAAYLIFGVIVLRVWHSTLTYILTEDSIITEKGFLVHKREVMKLSSVQYVTSVILPFHKYNSFNFIFAGALGGSIILLFLKDSDRKEIVSFINGRLSESKEKQQTDEQSVIQHEKPNT